MEPRRERQAARGFFFSPPNVTLGSLTFAAGLHRPASDLDPARFPPTLGVDPRSKRVRRRPARRLCGVV